MRADLYELLKEKHLEALRAYHAHPTLAAAAHSLGISESALNHRVGEARNILDLGSSREAAQWVAAHEQKLGFSRAPGEYGVGRFSPGSFSPIDPPPLTPPEVAETAIEASDEDGHVGEAVPQWIAPPTAHKAEIPWPFPTPGREINRAGWRMRLGMLLSAALILIVGGVVLTALIVGFQDELSHIQHLLARFT